MLRSGDTAARFGGDEFVVLCEDVGGEHEAVNVAERIAAALSEPFAVVGGGEDVEIRASIGIALARGAGVRPETLLRDADSAMYRSKQRGVAYEVFDDDMRRRASHRIGLESDLRRGARRGRVHAALPADLPADLGLDHRLRVAPALASPDARPRHPLASSSRSPRSPA